MYCPLSQLSKQTTLVILGSSYVLPASSDHCNIQFIFERNVGKSKCHQYPLRRMSFFLFLHFPLNHRLSFLSWLLKITMTKATYKSRHLMGGLVSSFRGWVHDHPRRSTVAGTQISHWSTGVKRWSCRQQWEREQVSVKGSYNLQAPPPQWHTSFGKSTPIPVRPHLLGIPKQYLLGNFAFYLKTISVLPHLPWVPSD